MPDTNHPRPDPQNRVWRVGAAEFDQSRRELRVGGQLRPVEAKPLLLLETLLMRAGNVVTKEELLATVWKGTTVVDQSLTTAIGKLREVLGDEGRAIVESVRGVGYRIGLPIELATAPEKPRLAFTFQPGDPVPNRPQWRLDRALGSSAARDVWLARHDKTGEQRVFKFADTTQRRRALQREAALSRILRYALGDRPDLVRITEWSFETRPAFIESPFGGDSLPEWAAAQGGLPAIPLAERIAIVAHVARTVAAAHDVGVLHRDIKPSNVLVRGEGQNLAIRLVDFGSGRLTEAARLEAVTVTGLGLTALGTDGGEGLSGTLRYMAPEIVSGGPPTIAADVYALGVMLYQVVVSDLDRPLGAGWESDVADVLLRDDVREAASVNAAKRLPSAVILAERLETLEARKEEQAKLCHFEREADRLARQVERARMRRPWLAFGVASLALGLAGTGLFALRAVRARDEAQRQSDVVKQVNSFLTDDLIGRGNPLKSGKADETLMEAASKAEPRIAQRFANEPIVAASIYSALAQAFFGRTAYAEARVAYDQAVAAYDLAEGKNSADATILRLRQVSMEVMSSQAGSIDRAKQLIDQSRLVVPTLGSRVPEALAVLLGAEGMLQLLGGDMQLAQLKFKVAADLADSMPTKFDEHSRFDLRQREAFAYLRLRRWAEADAILSPLFQQQVQLHGLQYPDTLIVRQTQAAVLMASGQSLAAIKAFSDLIPGLVAVYGPEHRLTLQAYGSRAQAEGMVEHYDDAIRDDMLVYKTSLAKQGSHAFYTFATLSDVATSECREGNPKVGLPHAIQAFADATATFGADNVVTRAILGTSVCLCLIMNKQYASAASYLNRMDLKSTSDFTADPDNEASVALMRAYIAANTGDHVRARELLRMPMTAFNRPDSDRFFHRWALELNRSLADTNVK